MTFSISATKQGPEKAQKVQNFRHALVRLMSLAHGNALEEISGDQFELKTIDVDGLDVNTLMHLKNCNEKYNFNKVEVLLHLIQSLITQAMHDDILLVPAPILQNI